MTGVLILLLAYLGGLFLVAPLGSLVGSIVGFGTALKRSEAWFFVASFTGAVVSFFLLRSWFAWLDVPFHWWSYLISMVSVVLFEGQRAIRGDSSLHAAGTTLGIVASIYWGFIYPPSTSSIT